MLRDITIGQHFPMSREVKVKQLSRNQKDELVTHGPVERPIS